MFRFMCLMVCVCTGAYAAYGPPSRPASRSAQLGGLVYQLQPAVTVQYLLPIAGNSYAPSYGPPASNYNAAPISSYGAAAPANNYGSAAPANNYGAAAPVSRYGAPAPANRYGASNQNAPVVDNDALNLARLALSLPSPGGPIVDQSAAIPRIISSVNLPSPYQQSNSYGNAPAADVAVAASAAGAASNVAGASAPASVPAAAY